MGTPEYPAEKVALQLLSGDVTGLNGFIATTCSGHLADVRSSRATATQIAELKKLFYGMKPLVLLSGLGSKLVLEWW